MFQPCFICILISQSPWKCWPWQHLEVPPFFYTLFKARMISAPSIFGLRNVYSCKPPFFSVLILLSPPSSILLISPLHQLQRNSLAFLGPFALFQATLFLSSCPSLSHRLTSVHRQQCVLFKPWKARGQRSPIEETPGLAGTEGGLWRERWCLWAWSHAAGWKLQIYAQPVYSLKFAV